MRDEERAIDGSGICIPTLQCTNQLSVDLRTVPRIPIRQCCFVRTSRDVVGGSVCNTAISALAIYLDHQTRRRTPGPLLLMVLVFTHTMSSHLRNPHLARTSRPLSKPSPAPLPTHSRTNEGSAERAGMGKSCRSVHEKDEENGGSISMTSNLVCCRRELRYGEVSRRVRVCVYRSLLESQQTLLFWISGAANVSKIESDFHGTERAYSSNRRAGSAPWTQFCGHSPPSTYLWL
jgi:hypothetical protein